MADRLNAIARSDRSLAWGLILAGFLLGLAGGWAASVAYEHRSQGRTGSKRLGASMIGLIVALTAALSYASLLLQVLTYAVMTGFLVAGAVRGVAVAPPASSPPLPPAPRQEDPSAG